MKTGVYKITCIENNKIYIGSAINIEKRIKTHFNKLRLKNHINPHLQNSYNLYGRDKFTWQIIEECEVDSLKQKEQEWMDKTNCYNRDIGFNNCLKADRPTGYKHTEKAKETMRAKKLGKKLSESHISKISSSNKGKRRTEEFKSRLSEMRRGSKNPMFGKKEDYEHVKNRMKNCLSTPRWNKGLTKKDDPRIAKLATWKGKLPPNALKCQLVDTITKISVEANSLKELAKKSGLSLSTVNRIKNGTAGLKIKQKYILIINES